MKLVDWVYYREDRDYRDDNYKPIIDLDNEIRKLRNPKRKWFIREDDEDVVKYSKDYNITTLEAKQIVEKENDKLPIYLDEEKANFYKEISEVCDQKLRKYCVKNHIFITDSEHQHSKIPVFQDDDGQKYLTLYSLRAWSDLMTDVWNEILKTDRFYYLDFYCNGRDDEIDEFLKNYNKT